MSSYTEHIAGPVTKGVQRCTRCKMVLPEVMGNYGKGPTGWTPGIVYQGSGAWLSQCPMNVTINVCRPPNWMGQTKPNN